MDTPDASLNASTSDDAPMDIDSDKAAAYVVSRVRVSFCSVCAASL
jgi:hypothetical protein